MKKRFVLDEDYDSLYRAALVVDDDDPDQLSRVQVRVFPELKDVEQSLLPWAKPVSHSLGQGSGHGVHHPPEIDSFVVVEIKQNWDSFYYDGDKYIEGYAQYGNFTAPSEIGTQTYPQPRFTLFKDGSVHFINTETGEQGVVTSTGTKIVSDANGKVSILSEDNIEIGNTSPKAAAREGDEILSNMTSDSGFWAMWSAFFAVITGPPIPEPGAGAPSALQIALNLAIVAAGGTPSSLTGKINEGSAQVTISD